MSQAIMKLVSGETIIGDVFPSEYKSCVDVKNPMIVRSAVDMNQRVVVSLMKWVETDENTFTIRADHIITSAAPSQFLSKYYSESNYDDFSLEDIGDEEEDEQVFQEDTTVEKIYH